MRSLSSRVVTVSYRSAVEVMVPLATVAPANGEATTRVSFSNPLLPCVRRPEPPAPPGNAALRGDVHKLFEPITLSLGAPDTVPDTDIAIYDHGQRATTDFNVIDATSSLLHDVGARLFRPDSSVPWLRRRSGRRPCSP